MIVRRFFTGIYGLITHIEARQAGIAQEEKINISETEHYDKAFSNSQDNPSEVIGGFTASAAVPHPEPKPHSGHLGHRPARLRQDDARCQLS